MSVNTNYHISIHKVLSYIDEHLDDELSLEILAEIGHYSPFHFHRIFKFIIKETPNHYINRKRLESSAGILMRNQEVTISELSLKFGFSSNSSFTRSFKQHFGINPSEFRLKSPNRYSKIRQTNSKNGQGSLVFEEYFRNINNHIKWMKMNSNIEVKELTQINLAYTSIVGISELPIGFDRILKWAYPKGIMSEESTKLIIMYHDSFKLTDAEKVRMDVCISIGQEEETGGLINKKTIEKGKFITGHFELLQSEFEEAWTGMFVWLNEHGYQVTNRPAFTILHNDFREHPEKKSIVDLCIPID